MLISARATIRKKISIFFLFHFCDSFNLLRYKYFHHQFEHITRVHRII